MKKILTVFINVIFILSLRLGVAFATPNEAAYVITPDVPICYKIAPGVWYTKDFIENGEGQVVELHVFRINFSKNPDLDIVPVGPMIEKDGKLEMKFDDGVRRTVRELVTKFDKESSDNIIYFANNCSMFNMKSGKIRGKIVKDGKVVNESEIWDNTFVIKTDRTCEIITSQERYNELFNNKEIKHSVTGNLLLVNDGKTRNMLNDGGRNASRPRTVIGIEDECGRIVQIAVIGRGGLNTPELAILCHIFGMRAAVNLDGGASSTVVVNKQITKLPDGSKIMTVIGASDDKFIQPTNSTGRPVADCLLLEQLTVSNGLSNFYCA